MADSRPPAVVAGAEGPTADHFTVFVLNDWTREHRVLTGTLAEVVRQLTESDNPTEPAASPPEVGPPSRAEPRPDWYSKKNPPISEADRRKIRRAKR